MAQDSLETESAVEAFLASIGHPTNSDPELRQTPARVAAAWRDELLVGYSINPQELFQSAQTASSSKDLVVVERIQAFTICPHHLLPAAGFVTVAYAPEAFVFGFGTICELVACYSKRMALQEDIAQNIAQALVQWGGARGAAAVVDFAPMCSTLRGPCQGQMRAKVFGFCGELSESEKMAVVVSAQSPQG